MKPTISVRSKGHVFSGGRAELTIVVDSPEDTRCDYIRATTEGSQGWRLGSGKHTVRQELILPERLQFMLLEQETVLAAGSRTEFKLAFDVPGLVPPSHALQPAWAYLEVFIHLSIPWRIDVRQRFHLDVHRPPPNDVPRLPFAVRSNPSTSAADAPRIELGVASRQIVAGEVLLGTVAVYHVEDDKPRDVELSLVPLIDTFGRRQRMGIPSRPLVTTVTIPAGHAGRNVPFRMQLPKNMTPTFETITHALRWVLNARYRMPILRRDLQAEAPLMVHDASAANIAAPLEAAPRLGDERIATLFAKFAAEHGWKGANPDGEDKDLDGKVDEVPGQFAIEQELDHATLRIAYDYRGEQGTYVMAGVRHPFLGLGLSVNPSSTMRHLMWRDIEVDFAPWDRAHHVVARDEAQTQPFLKEAVATMINLKAVGDLNHWNDHGIWWEQPIEKLDEHRLAMIAVDLGVFAQRLAKAMDAITPPSDVRVDLPALAALATRYTAVVCPGDLSLWRTPGGDPVHTELVRDEHGKAIRLNFAYGDEDLASEALREKTLELPRLGDVLGKDVPTELIEVLTGCAHRITNFSIANGVARCSLALPDPAVIDATAVREVVDLLRASLAAIVPATGPYR